MKFKRLIATLLILFTFGLTNAQEVKVKKNVVYVDGSECLTFSKDALSVTFSDKEGNEIMFMKYIHDSKFADLYVKIIFVDQKVSLTSQSYIFTKKILVEKLIKSKALVNCQLNEEKIESFIMKYDENVEEDDKMNIEINIDNK